MMYVFGTMLVTLILYSKYFKGINLTKPQLAKQITRLASCFEVQTLSLQTLDSFLPIKNSKKSRLIRYNLHKFQKGLLL